MNILNTAPPRLNPGNPTGSFQQMSDYLQNAMELIDFTLGRYTTQLKTVDADGVAESLSAFRADLVNLQRGLAGVDNRLNSVSGDVSALEAQVSGLSAQITGLSDALSALEARVAALENR